MKPFPLPRTLAEALDTQVQLAEILSAGQDTITRDPVLVAGMDVSYGTSCAYAALVVMRYPDLTFQSRMEARSPVCYPYIPGFFAFREIPPLLEAFSLAGTMPDLLFVHGHGYSHPRRVGIATHLGAFLGIPSIGVAGKPLQVMEASEPCDLQGAHSVITMEGETVGALVRTQDHMLPVYISAGYRTSLAQTITIALACCRHSRFPEPVLLADRAARSMRRRHEKNILQRDQV